VTLLSTIFIMYWLPTIIAIARQAHSALGVFLLNFLLGWTGLGWVLALIWSLAADNRAHEVIVCVDHRGDYGPR
jgi:Superinfection immunity protein